MTLYRAWCSVIRDRCNIHDPQLIQNSKNFKDEHTWVIKHPLCATGVNFETDLWNVRFKRTDHADTISLTSAYASDIISHTFNLHSDYEPVEVDSQILYVCNACWRREPHNCKTHNLINAHKAAVENFDQEPLLSSSDDDENRSSNPTASGPPIATHALLTEDAVHILIEAQSAALSCWTSFCIWKTKFSYVSRLPWPSSSSSSATSGKKKCYNYLSQAPRDVVGLRTTSQTGELDWEGSGGGCTRYDTHTQIRSVIHFYELRQIENFQEQCVVHSYYIYIRCV